MIWKSFLTFIKKNPLFYLWIILLFHVALRANNLFLDLEPNSFVDEGMFAHNIYTMIYDDLWYPPNQLLSGGFPYFICFIPNKLAELYFGTLTLHTSVIISRIVVLAISILLPLYLFKSMKVLGATNTIAAATALIASASPFSLAFTRIVYPDHFMPGLIAGLIFYLIKYQSDTKKKITLLKLGFVLGCIISTKYNGLYVIPAILLSMTLNNIIIYKNKVKSFYITAVELTLIVLIAVCIFFILTHKTVLDGGVQAALIEAHGRYSGGHLGATTDATLAFYSNVLFLLPVGVLGGLLILIGLCEFLYERKFSLLVFLITFTGIFLITQANYVIGFARNAALISPVVFLLSGAALNIFRKYAIWSKGYSYRLSLLAFSFLCLGIIFFEPASRSFIQLKNDYQQDSRIAAADWIRKNIGIQHNLGFVHAAWGGPYIGVPSFISPLTTTELPLGSDIKSLNGVTHYTYDSWQVDIHEKGVSMFSFNPFSELHFNNPARDARPSIVADHKSFISDFKLIKTFSNKKYYGPTVYIYKRVKFKKNAKPLKLGTWDFGQPDTWKLTHKHPFSKVTDEEPLEFNKKNNTYHWKVRKSAGAVAFERKFKISELQGRTFAFSFEAKTEAGKITLSNESYLLPSGVIEVTSVPGYTFDGSYKINKDWQTFKTKIIFPSLENYKKTENEHAIIRIITTEKINDRSIFIRNFKYREH